MQLPTTKILDMADLQHPSFSEKEKWFDEICGTGWAAVPCRRWEYVAALEFSGVVKKPGRCLDAGSGFTAFPRMLTCAGCEVDAIDINAPDGERNGITYHRMSMHDLSFDHGIFDYVFAISSIEHVNAGKFKIDSLPFDVGDTIAMHQLMNVLKPGGTLILTTDFADKYYPPPGLWPTGSHRIYDKKALQERLIDPFTDAYPFPTMAEPDLSALDKLPVLKEVEPIGYNYTEMIMTVKRVL